MRANCRSLPEMRWRLPMVKLMRSTMPLNTTMVNRMLLMVRWNWSLLRKAKRRVVRMCLQLSIQYVSMMATRRWSMSQMRHLPLLAQTTLQPTNSREAPSANLLLMRRIILGTIPAFTVYVEAVARVLFARRSMPPPTRIPMLLHHPRSEDVADLIGLPSAPHALSHLY